MFSGNSCPSNIVKWAKFRCGCEGFISGCHYAEAIVFVCAKIVEMIVFCVFKGSVREGRVMEQTQLEADQRGGCGELLGGD